MKEDFLVFRHVFIDKLNCKNGYRKKLTDRRLNFIIEEDFSSSLNCPKQVSSIHRVFTSFLFQFIVTLDEDSFPSYLISLESINNKRL